MPPFSLGRSLVRKTTARTNEQGFTFAEIETGISAIHGELAQAT